MICINCGHPKTSVVNSRPHKTTPKVWRRRSCPVCLTIVTTYERIDIADQIMVADHPYSVARLTVKLCGYLPVTPSQADEAFALAQTIGESLLQDKQPTISRQALTERIWKTLTRYNRKAGTKYGIDYDCIKT